MLKDRKSKQYSNIIKKLQNDNLRLNNENKALKAKLQEQTKLIEVTEKSKAEYEKALSALSLTKGQYQTAIKEIAAERKRYRQEFEKQLKRL